MEISNPITTRQPKYSDQLLLHWGWREREGGETDRLGGDGEMIEDTNTAVVEVEEGERGAEGEREGEGERGEHGSIGTERDSETVKERDEDKDRLNTDLTGSYIRISELSIAGGEAEQHDTKQPATSTRTKYDYVNRDMWMTEPHQRGQSVTQYTLEYLSAQARPKSSTSFDDYVEMGPDTEQKHKQLALTSDRPKPPLQGGGSEASVKAERDVAPNAGRRPKRKVPADYEHPVPSEDKAQDCSYLAAGHKRECVPSSSSAVTAARAGERETGKVPFKKYINIDIDELSSSICASHPATESGFLQPQTLATDSSEESSLDIACGDRTGVQRPTYINIDGNELPAEQPSIPWKSLKNTRAS